MYVIGLVHPRRRNTKESQKSETWNLYRTLERATWAYDLFFFFYTFPSSVHCESPEGVTTQDWHSGAQIEGLRSRQAAGATADGRSAAAGGRGCAGRAWACLNGRVNGVRRRGSLWVNMGQYEQQKKNNCDRLKQTKNRIHEFLLILKNHLSWPPLGVAGH